MLQVGDSRGWWLLGLALLLLLALVLRGRRRRVVSGTFFLVRRLAESLSLAHRHLRFRRRLARALFAAAAIGIALAGFGPAYTSGAHPVRELVIVDLSPSLGTLEDSTPRFRRLQEALKHYTALLQPQDSAVFIQAGPRTHVTVPLSGSDARDWVAGLDFSDAAADIPAALRIAAALEGASRFDHVLLFTDRPRRWEHSTAAGLPTALVPVVINVAAPVSNAGIEAFDLLPDPLNSAVFDIYVRFSCHTPAAAGRRETLVVTLLNNGREFHKLRRECRAGEAEELLLEDIPLELGNAEVRLDPDAYPADDRVLVGISSTPPLKVMLVSSGSRFLRTALESDPAVELIVVGPGETLPRDRSAIYVFDGPVPPGELPEKALFIQPDRKLDTLEARSFLSYPERVTWELEEAVLRGVDLEGLSISGMSVYPEAPGFRTIASADGRPLILLRAEAGRRWAVLAFDPSETTFVYSASYPILVANILRWTALFAAGDRPFFRVGETVFLPPASQGGTVRTPSGLTGPLPGVGSRSLPLYEARHPGRYEVRAADGGVLGALYFNVLDPAVTAEVGADGYGRGGGELPRELARGPLRVELAPWLALAALLLLAAEALFLATPVSRRE